MTMHHSYGIKDRIREGKRRLRMQLRLNKLDRELEAIAARQKLKEAQKFRNDVLEEAAEHLKQMRGDKPVSLSRKPFACGRYVGLGLAEEAVRKLKGEAMTLPSQFPIHSQDRRSTDHRKSVPWSMLAPHEEQALKNHSQSLETLASRGGLAYGEMLAVLEDRRWHKLDRDEAVQELERRVKVHAQAQP